MATPDEPGSLFVLDGVHTEMMHFYVPIGSELGRKNGGDRVEISIALRAEVTIETNYVPGWALAFVATGHAKRLA